jgi:hypothetical protein
MQFLILPARSLVASSWGFRTPSLHTNTDEPLWEHITSDLLSQIQAGEKKNLKVWLHSCPQSSSNNTHTVFVLLSWLGSLLFCWVYYQFFQGHAEGQEASSPLTLDFGDSPSHSKMWSCNKTDNHVSAHSSEQCKPGLEWFQFIFNF